MQITDEKAEDYGLWHFYKQFREDSNFMFIGGPAKTTLCLLNLYKLTGREDCLHSARITLEVLLKLRNKYGVLPDCVARSDIRKFGMHKANEETTILKDRLYGTPHFHSGVVSALVSGYLIMGEEKYLKAAAKMQHRLIAGFPDKFEDGFVCRFTVGRYIMGLSALMHTPLKNEFISPLREAIKYILPLQHRTGAFVSGVHGDLSGSSFETGIMCSNDEEITDNLYTNNYLGVALQMSGLKSEIGLDDLVIDKLLDFQVACQPLCALQGKTGAWTRAFNLRTGDPFAFNGDVGWGPYCMMTGWSNAFITLSLLLRLTGERIIL
jgi:hypothetical protein